MSPSIRPPNGPTRCSGSAFFAYADKYLIDVKFGIIMDVEASRAIRQAEVGASQTMIERTEACFGIKPAWLAGDTRLWLGPQPRLVGQPAGDRAHVPVVDESQREDGTFSREDWSLRRGAKTSIHARRARR